MSRRRVIGSELIEDARYRGRTLFEVFPGDILTALAKETADRVGLRLVEGPLDKPTLARTSGSVSMQRALYRRSPKWIAPSHAVLPKAQRFSKIALIGAGGVGANIAHLAANADMADEIALVDIAPDIAAATAMDLNHASGITRTRSRVIGSEKPEILAGADVIIVTAGRARSPGMTRADLIATNKRIIAGAAEIIRSLAPGAIILVVTNPLDEMTAEMLRATGFPRQRVLGMAGTLDSSRFRSALALAAGVTPGDVTALTLGSHGDEMAPIISLARIKGRPLDVFLSQEQIDACVKDTITGGAQIVALRKNGSATIAPAHASIEILDYIRGARAGSVPVSVMLEGEFDIEGVVVGVPAYLGLSGFISTEDINLTAKERLALQRAADAIRSRLGNS